jgi:hypothetical protein
MAIAASVKELAEQQSEQLAKSFAGILQSVVPDVTKSLAKAAESFKKSLITGSNKNIQTAYGNLKSFLNNFDVSISDLGGGFRDVEQAFKSLKNQFADADDKIEKLREKNIFAEKELVVNKKNNNLEVRATILTDQQLFKKRETLLAKEQKLKAEEKDYLAKIRQVQSGEVKMEKPQKATLLKKFENNQDELKNIEELKKLYQGKSGLAIGVLDRFERTLEDNAPAFLQAAFSPIIDIARQFQKTFGLLISGIKSTAKFIGKFLPDSVKKGFGSMFNGLKKTLKGVTGGLLMFGKRVFMAGLALLTAIVAPLIPLIIPMLKFAAVIGAVVAGLFILKKAFNWFRESWLGKKLGLDKESTDKAEVKDRKEGTGKYQSLEGEMDFGDTGVTPPKVTTEKPLMPKVKPKILNGVDDKIQSMEKTFGFSKEKVGDPEYNNAIADKAKTVPAIGESWQQFKNLVFEKDKIKETIQSINVKDVTESTKIQNKVERLTPVKKDLVGESTSTSSNVTTVVNNQPSSSSTRVSNTSVLSPINVSSGDNYFDRQASSYT